MTYYTDSLDAATKAAQDAARSAKAARDLVGAPADAAVAAAVNGTGTQTRGALDGRYAQTTFNGKGLPRFVMRSNYATFDLAKAAAGSGGIVWYDQATTETGLTVDTPLTIDGAGVTITKGGNGPIFTVTAKNVKFRRGISLDGAGGTYTGVGIAVTGNGTTQDLEVDCDILGTDQQCITFGTGAGQRATIRSQSMSTRNKVTTDAAMTAGSATLTSATANFTAADVGRYALVLGAYDSARASSYHIAQITAVASATSCTLAIPAGATISATSLEVHHPCVAFGDDSSTTGDRTIVGLHTLGFLGVDVGGVQTVGLIGLNTRGVIFSASNSQKVSMAGCRVAPSGGPTILHGTSHAISGCVFSGDVILETDCNNSAMGADNTLATGMVLVNKNNSNSIPAARVDPPLPVTMDPVSLSAASALNANQAVYMRVRGSGYISKIGMHVGTSSGNICVGVYANSGAGSSAAPSTRKGTSGSVACPVAGYAEVPLTAPVWCADGDWIALVADNATATFYRGGAAGFASSLAKGRTNFQSTAFPLPATAASGTGFLFSLILTGVI
ncbi:MAG: hypothetical protein HOQ21_04450 [Dermatophilaceae bacterium]|nr:hypothetical protein [Dermatophilaceae bacterium]